MGLLDEKSKGKGMGCRNLVNGQKRNFTNFSSANNTIDSSNNMTFEYTKNGLCHDSLHDT